MSERRTWPKVPKHIRRIYWLSNRARLSQPEPNGLWNDAMRTLRYIADTDNDDIPGGARASAIGFFLRHPRIDSAAYRAQGGDDDRT